MAGSRQQAQAGRRGGSTQAKAQGELLRAIPSVEELLETRLLRGEARRHGRQLVVNSARTVLDRLRRQIAAGKAAGASPGTTGATGGRTALTAADLRPAKLAPLVRDEAARVYLPSLHPLINASGVVVHTNLGRSVLPPAAIAAVSEIAASYSNLEYNLELGKRGSRHDHITRIITALTGAEDALVVNNNAAAVLLALTTFARRREVIVSRGELIEIGGSFRIPDIMAASTAKLVEVGTTNKTKIADYEKAITKSTAMLLHVHSSNYKVVGFTAEVPISALVRLGHKNGILVMDDLGSGALADLPALADEPSVFDSLAAGADIVTFSGDKLLGGPQAGIIVGRHEPIARMKAHPMARAMRVDKMTLAALQATLALYLNPKDALREIPTLRMLSEKPSVLQARAGRIAAGLKQELGASAAVGIEKAASKVGGGALPLLELDSWVCTVVPETMSVDRLAERLRHTQPPVVGRIHRERLLLDARTVLPAQVDALVGAVAQAIAQP